MIKNVLVTQVILNILVVVIYNVPVILATKLVSVLVIKNAPV